MKKIYKKWNWPKLAAIKQNAPIITYIVLFYCLAEILVIFIFPYILPKTLYLSIYLNNKAVENTNLFLKNQNLLIPDDSMGWKNHPNIIRDNWIIDQHGSRATHEFSFQKQKSIRVMFLGSSMINGGTHITNHETISAFMEDEEIETLNFGTMMYSLDQVLLAYQNQLYKFNADIIIVGIDIGPCSGLINHYIPFKSPEEDNVPYLKPRFELNSGKLHLISISPDRLLKDVPENEVLIKFLSENDGFYYKFSTFCHLGILPVSGGIRQLYLRARNFVQYFESEPKEQVLLEAIMRKIEFEAINHGAKVLFLMNTNEKTLLNSGIHKYLKDLYGEELKLIRSKGFNVIDVRGVLRDSLINSEELFYADRVHYSVKGNQIIADALKKELYKDTKFGYAGN